MLKTAPDVILPKKHMFFLWEKSYSLGGSPAFLRATSTIFFLILEFIQEFRKCKEEYMFRQRHWEKFTEDQ